MEYDIAVLEGLDSSYFSSYQSEVNELRDKAVANSVKARTEVDSSLQHMVLAIAAQKQGNRTLAFGMAKTGIDRGMNSTYATEAAKLKLESEKCKNAIVLFGSAASVLKTSGDYKNYEAATNSNAILVDEFQFLAGSYLDMLNRYEAEKASNNYSFYKGIIATSDPSSKEYKEAAQILNSMSQSGMSGIVLNPNLEGLGSIYGMGGFLGDAFKFVKGATGSIVGGLKKVVYNPFRDVSCKVMGSAVGKGAIMAAAGISSGGVAAAAGPVAASKIASSGVCSKKKVKVKTANGIRTVEVGVDSVSESVISNIHLAYEKALQNQIVMFEQFKKELGVQASELNELKRQQLDMMQDQQDFMRNMMIVGAAVAAIGGTYYFMKNRG